MELILEKLYATCLMKICKRSHIELSFPLRSRLHNPCLSGCRRLFRERTASLSGFLTQDELEYLTGYKRVNDQCRFLALEGIDFFISRESKKKVKVVVAWNAVTNRGAVAPQSEGKCYE